MDGSGPIETGITLAPASSSSRRAAGSGVALGIAAGLTTVAIWAGWIVATRFAVRTTLDPGDIAFLRYVAASLVLAPVLLSRGVPVRRIGAARSAMIVAGAGAPFLLVSSTGMEYAPASHVGAVMVGTMPLAVAVLSALLYRESFSRSRIAGFAVVVLGTLCLGGGALLTGGADGEWKGDLLFVAAALLWAGYTMAVRGAGLGAWHAAALVNVGSLVVFAPVYLLLFHPGLGAAPWRDIGLQVLVQLGSAVIALYAYNEAIRRLGASQAAAVTSLTPVVATLLGIPLLGEVPGSAAWLGIVAVTLGVVLASGAVGARRR